MGGGPIKEETLPQARWCNKLPPYPILLLMDLLPGALAITQNISNGFADILSDLFSLCKSTALFKLHFMLTVQIN